MKQQIIITVGREFGSGGHEIAEKLAEKLDLWLYDKKLVEEIMEISGYTHELISKLDEKRKNVFLSRRIGEHSNSLEENIAQKTFEMLRKKAASGESFVVVGRCADYILRENPNVFKVFISADMESKMHRIMELNKISANSAKKLIKETDRKRRNYHNHYSSTKWGDSRHYDILLNTSKFGVEHCVDILETAINFFKEI